MSNMIQVKNVSKEFKKVIKEPGLKGSVKSLFHKKTEIVKAVDNISFEYIVYRYSGHSNCGQCCGGQRHASYRKIYTWYLGACGRRRAK